MKALLVLGLPLVGGNLAQFAISLTDTVMVGWYGVPELAALSLASAFFMTLFLFGSGFAWAIMPLVATYAARDDQQMIRRATRMALWLSALFFAVVMPLLWASAPILRVLGQTPEVAELSQTYLRIAGWGMLPALFVMVLKSYLAGLEHSRVVLWVTVAAAVANAIANYALIFGNWGAPELGIAGAAWASMASHTTALIGVMVYVQFKLPQHAMFKRFWHPDWEVFGNVFKLGWPVGIATLAEVALFAGTSALMGNLGVVPLAAHGIVIQLSSMTFMVQVGLSNAATVRAGNALGRGDAAHLAAGARAALFLGAIGVVLSVLLFVTLPDTLLSGFIDPANPLRAEILEMGRVLLWMAALFQLVDAAQVVHLGLLRGLHDTRAPMIIAAVSFWVVGMPAAWWLGLHTTMGPVGVWLGLSTGLALAAVLLAWRFWTWGVRVAVRA